MAKKISSILNILLIIIAMLSFLVLLGVFYNLFVKSIYPTKYEELVTKYSSEYNVEPELVYSIIKAESNFKENVESRAGAIGLMQIMPQTFYWLQTCMGEDYISEEYLNDPEINIRYGTYLIKLLKQKYSSDILVICAYNAGMGVVDRWLNEPGISIDGQTLNYIPYGETERYLERVIKNREIYTNLYFKK